MRSFVSLLVAGLFLSGSSGYADEITAPVAKTPAWFSTLASPPPFLPEADVSPVHTLPPAYLSAANAAQPATVSGDSDNQPFPLTGMAAGGVPAPVYLNPNSFAYESPASPASIEPGAYVPATTPNYMEAGLNYFNVSKNQGNWFGQFADVQYQSDAWNRWNAQLQHEQAFHDSGISGGIGNTHIFDEDWYSDIGASAGSNASFLTRYRVDADINRKWLEGRNFITTVGVTWDEAQQIYSDKALLLAVAYYFPSPWIVQAGVRINDSTPGNVIAPSGFAAVTYGFQKKYFLTARYGIAREAYQLLGTGNINSSFTSHTVGVNWRQWLGEDWGFNLGSEYYTNPYYDRTGGIVSVFKEF